MRMDECRPSQQAEMELPRRLDEQGDVSGHDFVDDRHKAGDRQRGFDLHP